MFKHEVIEVDFDTAVRWGFVQVTGFDANEHYTYKVIVGGEANVEVSYLPPSATLPNAVVYKDWYTGIFVSGAKNEYIVEDIPANPRRWCITTSQDCIGKWKVFIQPGNDRLTR
jgi:hypothetical protein